MEKATLAPALVLGDINLIRPLGQVGVPVTLATSDVTISGARSRYCHRVVRLHKSATHEETVQALLAVEWPEDPPPALFYQADTDLLMISRYRQQLSRRYRFAIAPAGLVEDLVDKARFLALAQRLDLPIPRSQIVTPGPSAGDQLESWDCFPCVVKPTLHSPRWSAVLRPGSVTWAQKALRVEDRSQLGYLRAAIELAGVPVMIQKCVEGPEDRIVSFHAYVRPDGECVTWFTGRKVRTYPRAYGKSTCVAITDDPRVRDAGTHVMRRLGLTGVLKIDFKEDPCDGRLHLLEVNPRFNLWHYPGAAAGANIPGLVYNDLYDMKWPLSTEVRPGMRWVWMDGDFRSFLEHHRAGELGLGQWLSSLRRCRVFQPFAWDDPKPMVTALWAPLRRRFARASGNRN